MNRKSDHESIADALLKQRNERILRVYQIHPGLIKEHYGIEQTVLAGGYGYKQLLELVQNGADAILESCETGIPKDGRISVLLRSKYLYVANTGAPLSAEGIDALLSSHNSPKRGNQIGRFGLGFKSLLRLGGRIDIFSRSFGNMRFNPERCRRELQKTFGIQDVPGMRLAWPLNNDPNDQLLIELISSR